MIERAFHKAGTLTKALDTVPEVDHRTAAAPDEDGTVLCSSLEVQHRQGASRSYAHQEHGGGGACCRSLRS